MFKFLQAIDKCLKMVIRLRCWNHTINAVKFWLKKHGANPSEIPAYTSHVRELLDQTSCANYEKKLDDLKVKWSKAFEEYFMNELHPEVKLIFTWV